MQKAQDFDRSEVCLHEFRSERWQGFIFVTFSAAVAPLKEKYRSLQNKFIGKWQLDDAKVVWSAHWHCDFNWKILLENFMEAYHHLGAHMKTLEPFLPARGCWAEPYDAEFSAMHLPLKTSIQTTIRESGAPATAFPIFPGLTLEDCTEWGIYLGFPNFLLFTAPDRVFWYRLLPTGPETCSLMTTMIVARSTPEMPGYAEILKNEVQAGIDFHLEDMEVCVATQRGMNSRGHAQGRLSHLEVPIWHFEKYLARVIEGYQAALP